MWNIQALTISAVWILPVASVGLHGMETFETNATSIDVDPVYGNADNAGNTPEQAFQTIEQARNLIRENRLNKNMQSNVAVYLRGGRYERTETLVFDPRDSSSNRFYVVYRNFEAEEPILCGGYP